jgi:electron transport complex protein RnfC
MNGNKVKCVVIENDFKEKTESRTTVEKINTYSKQEFIDIIRESGIVGLGGAGFPTYVKYTPESINTLVVNAVECEPYITADFSLTIDKVKKRKLSLLF